MKRLAIALSVISFLGGVGVFAVLSLVAPGFVGDKLSALARETTGLDLAFRGQPRLEFLPELAVRIDDVTLTGPEGPVAVVAQVRLGVSLGDVLIRRFAPSSLELEQPMLKLAVNPEGVANWIVAGAAGLAENGPAIIIRNGGLSFLDERSGDGFDIQELDARLARGENGQGGKIDAAFVWQGDRLKLQAFVRNPGQAVETGSPVDFSVQSSRMDFSFSGLARLEQGLTLAGQMDAKVPDVLELARWSGMRVPEAGNSWRLSASGPFESRIGRMMMRGGNYQLNGMNARGDVVFSSVGKRPQLAANLGFDRLNLNSLTAAEPADAAPGWSAAPIDLSGLSALDAKIALAASEAIWGRLKGGRTNLEMELKDGVLSAKLGNMVLGAGTATGRLTLGLETNVPRVSVSFQAKAADGTLLAAPVFYTGSIAGPVDMVIEATSSGSTVEQMIAQLAGTGNVLIRKGSIENTDLSDLIRTATSRIVTGWARVDTTRTPLDQLSASFTIADGIVTTKDLRMEGPGLRIIGRGDIDFLRHAMNLQADVGLAEKAQGAPVALPVGMVARGPWGAPKIYPNMPGVLDDPERAYAAIRAMRPAQAPGATP